MRLAYKFIPEGPLHHVLAPLSMAFVDYKDVLRCGLSMREACEKIAAQIPGPAAINMFDMDAVTTNSDGVMLDGSMTCMAASDYGKINPEFGFVEMLEIPYDPQLIAEEPHLRQWDANYKGRRLLMGPDPDNKPLPIHNAVISGRAGNNNSATEVMNCVTMEEMLLPVIGQMEIMRDGDLEVGKTGHVVSVGIGFLVGEKYGRIVPNRQYRCGDTGHNSGEYAKYLKCHIPCIVADKKVLAKYIIKALTAGMIPGRDIGPSPAVLAVARHFGVRPDYGNMTEQAFFELADVGFTREWMLEDVERLDAAAIIERARDIIPGVEDVRRFKAPEVVQTRYADV
ncbi:conserved hypothetical protein [uncultured delta proteobacterium]|uniref:Uncharacterized protein n=1 Tax=uncultured delta proteobacterium TaxID=34034 RepID=A0A212KDT1_9DELT|nr:conserved hypothetical protein [uncultured delta proteobacterium]